MTNIKYEDIVNLLKKRNINSCTISNFTLVDSKPNVFIRHDADVLPYRLLPLMRTDLDYGLVSSNYIFWNSPLSQVYPLDIDVPAFQKFNKLGFEIGYHAWCIDMSVLTQLSVSQCGKLSRFFNLCSYSCHDENMKQEIVSVFKSTDVLKHLKCYSDTIFETGRLAGYITDTEHGFKYVISSEELIQKINSIKSEQSKITHLIKHMADGSVYSLTFQTQFWDDGNKI